MNTRAAAKREADFLEKSFASGGLSPKRKRTSKDKNVDNTPVSPWGSLPVSKAVPVNPDGVKFEEQQNTPLAPSKASSKSQHSPAKRKKRLEPVVGQSEELPHNLGQASKYGGRIKQEGEQNAPLSTHKASGKEVAVIARSDGGLEQDPGLAAISKDAPKTKLPKTKRPKANSYGLTPGATPFPHHSKPTEADCEEVARLLAAKHGLQVAPEVIPPPSMARAGCGEVPDLLDAVLRTVLSATTTAHNATLALNGLKKTFGVRKGINGESPDYEAVRLADKEIVIDSIKHGGLAETKGKSIKLILDMVYEENCRRRDALLEERKSGKPADIPGAKDETEDEKKAEIANTEENLLSMDYIFNIKNDHEAMCELVKLPGVGVKTASCVMLFCMKRPSFAVDTHVWRHCKWLGWVPQTANRDSTFNHLDYKIPDHLKYPLHWYFLKHGKECFRCSAKTVPGSATWNNTVCPIEHLVNRFDKQPGYDSGGKHKKGKVPGPDKVKAAARAALHRKARGKKGESDEESVVDMDESDGDYE